MGPIKMIKTTVRWFQNPDKTWYGLLREEEANRLGLATKKVHLFGKAPNNLAHGDVWISRMTISRYFFDEHLKSTDTDRRQLHLEAIPLQRYHVNGHAITRQMVEKAKKTSTMCTFGQNQTQVDSYQVYRELHPGCKSLGYLWRVFDGQTLVGIWVDQISQAVIGTTGCPDPFEVIDLEQAIKDLGKPEIVHTADRGPIAIWEDACGNTLQASIAAEALFKAATRRELKKIHAMGTVLYGEFALSGTVANTATLRLASGECVIGTQITPAHFTNAAAICSPKERERMVQTMRDHDLLSTIESHQNNFFEEVLLEFDDVIAQANRLANRGERQNDVILVQAAKEHLENGHHALMQQLSTILEYTEQPNPLFYPQNESAEIKPSPNLVEMVERLSRYQKNSMQRIESELENLNAPTLRSPDLHLIAAE